MSKRLLVAVFAVAIGLVAPAAAAAARELRFGSAPPLPSSARVLGAMASATPLALTLALQPRDPAALAAYAAAVSDPTSPDYHHYLSVAEFAQRFGPTAATVAAVRASLQAHGLRPGALSPNGLALSLATSAATAARGFATSFQQLSLRSGRRAYVNTSAPSLDASIAGHVQAIIGLDTIVQPTPQGLSRAPRRNTASVAHVASAAGPVAHASSTIAPPMPCTTAMQASQSNNNAYTADQIAGAYGFNGLYGTGDFGAGQTVALLELENNNPSDISAFQRCYGTNASVTYTQIDGGPGPSTDPSNGQETDLDIENLIGLAPQVNVIVYQGPRAAPGPYDTYNAIISQDRAQVISTSWGDCESDLGQNNAQAESTLFQEAAVQGQTIVAASGDNGAQDCYDPKAKPPDTTPNVDDPASQPYVTGVGGTSLSYDPSTSPPTRKESVWNSSVGASGGGDSSLWPMPGYQSSAPSSLNVINAQSYPPACTASGGASFCRQVPDVSAEADESQGYLVYWNGDGTPTDSGAWTHVGGTSGATPVWAALFALANSSSACSAGPVGFVNPALYRLASGPDYGLYFNDIKVGNNDWTGTNNGLFPAGPGYDQASGLGSPIASALALALCGQKTLQVTAPGPQSTLAGRPISLQLQSSDVAGQTVTYTSRGLPPGLRIDGNSGLISGTPTAAGTFNVTITAIDQAMSTAGASFTWTVTAATLKLTAPGSQRGRVKHATKLQLRAADNNGQPTSFAAAGLPHGLLLNPATGLISGRPTKAGAYTVTAVATAIGAPAARISFRWTVAGAPSSSHISLTGIAAGKPTLGIRFAAGIQAPALRTITVALPTGLSFSHDAHQLGRGISITDGGHRLRFSVRRSGATLRITLRSADSRPRLKITWPALSADAVLSRRVRGHQAGRLSIRATVADAAQLVSAFKLSLRAS